MELRARGTPPVSSSPSSAPLVSSYMGWLVPFPAVGAVRSKRASPVQRMLPPVHRNAAFQRRLHQSRKAVSLRSSGVMGCPPEPSCSRGSSNILELVSKVLEAGSTAMQQQNELLDLRRTAVAAFLQNGGDVDDLTALLEELAAGGSPSAIEDGPGPAQNWTSESELQPLSCRVNVESSLNSPLTRKPRCLIP
eukprot:RCo022830